VVGWVDSVVGWVDSNGNAVAPAYYQTGHVPPILSTTWAIQNIIGTQVNQMTTIFFTRNFSSGQFPIDPSGFNVVIGSLSPDDYAGVEQHGLDGHTNGKISINFATGASSIIVDPLYDAHGVLMFLGWGVIIPLGMLFARYFRHLPGPIWFDVHRVLQPLGYLIALVGFIIALIMVKGQIAVPHGQFGISIMIVGFFQVLFAIFRPHKEPGSHPTTARKCFEYGHWWVGRLLVLAGIANVFVGIAQIGVGWPAVAFPVFGVFVGLLVLAVVVREVQNCISPIDTIVPLFKVYAKKKDKDDDYVDMNH